MKHNIVPTQYAVLLNKSPRKINILEPIKIKYIPASLLNLSFHLYQYSESNFAHTYARIIENNIMPQKPKFTNPSAQ